MFARSEIGNSALALLRLWRQSALLLLLATLASCQASQPSGDSLSPDDWIPPRSAAVPGGIAVVPIPDYSPSEPPPSFRDRPLWMAHRQSGWVAVVGIPLDQEPGEALLKRGAESIPFAVLDKDYPESRLQVSSRYVSPPAETLERIGKERKEINQQFAHYSQGTRPKGQFAQPISGIHTSLFGLRRFFNGQPRRPHSGLDIAADLGTPVQAPAPAMTLHTGDYYFNGKTVFLDHGQGLISMYCHLDEILVSPGQPLEKGELLGKVGKTGRVTGAHLHWSMNLNGVMIDPLLFLAP